MSAPPPPMVENADWHDATELIKRAAGDLGVGHMLHQEGYSMNEAMSALELMDQKMDSGTGYQSVRLYDERVASGQLKPIAVITWEEALSAMDFIERAQAAYYDGASAAQTTFTLHYFYHAASAPIAPNTATLPHRFLDIFCKLTLRSDEDVRQLISRSGVLDEEDFVTMNYGWPSGDALREEELLRGAKELLEFSSTDPSVALGQERLRIRRALYMALLSLERVQLDAARKHLTLIANRPAPPAVASLPAAFLEPLIIRRFEVPAAPRPISIPDSAAAHKAATLTASRLLLCIDHYHALQTPLSFIDTISRLRHVASWGQVERAHLAFLLSRDELKSAVIRHYQLETSLPKFLLESKLVADGSFPPRASAAMQLFFVTLCFNRSRSRRRMVHVFEELNALSGDALVADSMRTAESPLYGPYFTVWTHDLTIISMVLHLEAGLSTETSLQLYHPRELPWLFFYLEYLHMRRVTGLRNAAGLAAQAMKRFKAGKKRNEAAHTTSPLLLQAELQYLITRAIGCLFAVHASVVKGLSTADEESFPFGTHELRWSTRFYALLRVGHVVPAMSHATYAKKSAERLARPLADVTKECSDALEQVRDRVKTLLNPAEGAPAAPAPLQEEARRVARVAVLNGLSLAKAAARKAPLPRHAQLDFTAHPVYPVFQF